jgi:hypothetical protein
MPWNINSRKRTSVIIRINGKKLSREQHEKKEIEASQEQSHGPTKEALEACPRTCPNPQERESRKPSIRQNLMLGSQVFMLW